MSGGHAHKGHDDYAVEPVRGLPENLPAGEHILWQGAPRWWEMAKHVFHIRAAALYFAVLMAWRASGYIAQGKIGAALLVGASLLPISLLGLGLLAVLAWLCSSTSVYTITNKRVVMRIGVALPTSINIPFTVIVGAGLRHAGGAGDIALTVNAGKRMAYSNLWPHVRPWRLNNPEPSLRCIEEAKHVAGVLSRALAEALPAECVMVSKIEDESANTATYPFGAPSPVSPAGLSAAAGQVA